MSAANVLKFIKEKEAEFVDLRFTDPRGKLQHLTIYIFKRAFAVNRYTYWM